MGTAKPKKPEHLPLGPVDPGPSPLQRQIFVAYAYSLYDKRDYRSIFTTLGKIYSVKFVFADEKITNVHILQKIISYIKASDFSIFDISGWNPNVTLELGVALALSDNWYICYNPSKESIAEVPSDIKGLDRLQYASFAELSEKITALLEQRYPKDIRQSLDEFISALRENVWKVILTQPGLKMGELATILKVEIRVVIT